jgi:hypothetical protein
MLTRNSRWLGSDVVRANRSHRCEAAISQSLVSPSYICPSILSRRARLARRNGSAYGTALDPSGRPSRRLRVSGAGPRFQEPTPSPAPISLGDGGDGGVEGCKGFATLHPLRVRRSVSWCGTEITCPSVGQVSDFSGQVFIVFCT